MHSQKITEMGGAVGPLPTTPAYATQDRFRHLMMYE